MLISSETWKFVFSWYRSIDRTREQRHSQYVAARVLFNDAGDQVGFQKAIDESSGEDRRLHTLCFKSGWTQPRVLDVDDRAVLATQADDGAVVVIRRIGCPVYRRIVRFLQHQQLRRNMIHPPASVVGTTPCSSSAVPLNRHLCLRRGLAHGGAGQDHNRAFSLFFMADKGCRARLIFIAQRDGKEDEDTQHETSWVCQKSGMRHAMRRIAGCNSLHC